MLPRMPRSTVSRSELPTTTKTAPTRMIPPTMRVFALEAKRFRKAIWTSTPTAPARDRMALPPSRSHSRAVLAAGHLAIRDADDGGGVRHHLRIVGGEDEGRAVLAVHLLHEVDDVPAGLRVEVGGRFVGEYERWTGDERAR